MHLRSPAILLALLLFTLGQAGAVNKDLAPFEASYELSHGLVGTGEAKVRFQRGPGDRYVYSSRSRARGLAGLFDSGRLRERSEGWVTDDTVRPRRYLYERTGSKAREAYLQFDWREERVTNDVEGTRWNLDIRSNTVDRLSLQIAVMHALANGRHNLSFSIADGGQLRSVRFRVGDLESIDTPAGTFEALRVEQVDDDGPDITFWVAPELDYLPVRLEHDDLRGRTSSMRLTEYTLGDQ